ncbi:MAG: site-2 protease family protein [Gemmatimonadales bacterium]
MTLLACPACGRLVHGAELKRLAEEAERAQAAGDLAAASAAWRQALDLLPFGTRQRERVSERFTALSKQLDAQPAAQAVKRSAWASGAGLIGVLGLFLWKFKFILVFLLTKGKLLLLGLTKASTFFSMILSLGVYWAVWGWKFAAGLIASIYIHEMGHVAMLRKFGIKATAPMFIPGFGAIIRTRAYPNDRLADARVGLAGPIWGLGAALTAFTAYLVTDIPYWGALARIGALVNLFNLAPIWQLDGGWAFNALNRRQRWIAVAAIGAVFILTAEGMLLLLLLVAFGRAAAGQAPDPGDRRTLWEYGFLVAALALLMELQVPISAAR